MSRMMRPCYLLEFADTGADAPPVGWYNRRFSSLMRDPGEASRSYSRGRAQRRAELLNEALRGGRQLTGKPGKLVRRLGDYAQSYSFRVAPGLHPNSTARKTESGAILRKCQRCGEVRPNEDFPLCSGVGRRSWCRECWYSAEAVRGRHRWSRFFPADHGNPQGDREIALRILETYDLRDLEARDVEFLESLSGFRRDVFYFRCQTCGKEKIRGPYAHGEKYCRHRDGRKSKCNQKKHPIYRATRKDAKMTCRKCGETKPAGKFAVERSIPGGRRKTCNRCRNAQRKNRRKST